MALTQTLSSNNFTNLVRSKLTKRYLLLLGLLVVSFLASFLSFRQTGFAGIAAVNPAEDVKNRPGDATCPLNGAQWSKDDMKEWEGRRPLGVMIENHTESRPQSGLSKADVVYEAVAEGGITRFMGVYLCQDVARVGPVRSARTYFLDWISEYDGLYAHVGGAGTPGPADALGQIERYGIKALNQFNLGFPTFERDQKRINQGIAIEHTMYSSTDKLWDAAVKKFGLAAEDKSTKRRWDESFTPWKFQEDAALERRGASSSAQVPFWDKGSGDYRVEWTYDKQNNVYQRATGGIDAVDELSDEQIVVKNVVIQFMKEQNANDGYPGNVHLLYGTTGTGEAIILQNGQVIQGTWAKADRLARTKYTDKQGKEIQFIRGLIWIQTVPTYNRDQIKI